MKIKKKKIIDAQKNNKISKDEEVIEEVKVEQKLKHLF